MKTKKKKKKKKKASKNSFQSRKFSPGVWMERWRDGEKDGETERRQDEEMREGKT